MKTEYGWLDKIWKKIKIETTSQIKLLNRVYKYKKQIYKIGNKEIKKQNENGSRKIGTII